MTRSWPYRAWIDEVADQAVAAVCTRVAQSEIAKVFGGALDEVWDFLRWSRRSPGGRSFAPARSIVGGGRFGLGDGFAQALIALDGVLWNTPLIINRSSPFLNHYYQKLTGCFPGTNHLSTRTLPVVPHRDRSAASVVKRAVKKGTYVDPKKSADWAPRFAPQSNKDGCRGGIRDNHQNNASLGWPLWPGGQ